MAETSCMKKLEGKVAIITGGASGIGEATARVFAKHGPRAIVIADVQDDLGSKVAESIGSDICSYFRCDVSNEGHVESMVDWTIQTYGQLDILFSNAGVLSRFDQKLLDLDLTELDRIFAVNAQGMATCLKHAARVMVERHTKGSIVCTASVAASKGFHKATDYHMAKHAVLGLMRCASKQLGEYGIRVNSVSPYVIATPMMSKAYNMGEDEIQEQFKPFTSLKDVTLKVNHVADAVLFLASDDSAFITGHDLLIDGGITS